MTTRHAATASAMAASAGAARTRGFRSASSRCAIAAPSRGVGVGRPRVRGPREAGVAARGLVSQSSGLRELTSVVESQQFDRGMLEDLFEVTREMERITKEGGECKLLSGKVMGTLFYEPSTRTRLSFETAMCRLGGKVVSTENAREFSSVAKGETLEDTIRTLEQYVDVIVLRHFQAGSARIAADAASVPLVSAGDGPGQHPTQALLDLYTIQKEIGRIDGTKVALVGDLANGRTARSLAYVLSKFDQVKLYFVAPDVARIGEDIKEHLTENNVAWEESDDLASVAREVDVLYQTRIQKERYGDRPEDYEKAQGKFIVDERMMRLMQRDSVVMHPLPRVGEIAPEVDADPRAAYFRQAKNGLYIRMALLATLLQ